MHALELRFPRWLRDKGIRPNEKGGRVDVLIYGADSETLHGEPMTLQFFSKDVKLNELHWVNKKTAQRTFLAFCNRLQRDCLHVVYVHNLDFDLPEFLWGSHSKLIGEGSGEYKFQL